MPPPTARELLRADVRRAITAHVASFRKPSFSIEQLMVMALVQRSCSGGPVTEKGIFDWIASTFAYYTQLVINAAYFHGSQQRSSIEATNGRLELRRLVADISAGLHRFDMPLICLVDGKVCRSLPKSDREYNADTSETRNWLQCVLPANNAGHFRFTSLPPEIRLMIYECVLKFPSSGLRYCKKDFGTGKVNRFAVHGHERQGTAAAALSNPTKWEHDESSFSNDDHWRTPPIAEILSLLVVNKLVHREAVPVFYSANHFYVPGIPDLLGLIRRCGPERRKFFTSISFHYYNPAPTLAKKAFGLLASLPKLRRLGISANETKLLTFVTNSTDPASAVNLQPVEDITMIKLLAGVQVQVVNFYQDTSKMEAYLKPKMLLPKTDEPEVVKDPKKRSRGSGTKGAGEAQGSGRGRGTGRERGRGRGGRTTT